MVLPKLETSHRIATQAFEAIRNAIINGEYPAGRRLQIRDLAKELGISVMPVREAITRLEESGLVESKPYRGAVVKELTLEEVLQIYNVRRLLEVEAATLGAPRVSSQGIERLEDLQAQMAEHVRNGRFVEYLDLDEEILTIVYRASGNRVLTETIQALWVRCRHFKIMGARDELTSRLPEGLLDHQKHLILAVRNGDGEDAARATQSSLDDAIARIKQTLTARSAAPQDASHQRA